MGGNCKNWRRCNIGKKRLNKNYFYKLFFGLFIVFLSSMFNLFFIDNRLNQIFVDYIDIEVKKICNNIISNAINNYISNEDNTKFLVKNYNAGDSGNLSYDTEKLNKFSSGFSKYLNNVLTDVDIGNLNDNFSNSRFNNYNLSSIRNGFLCNISLGSINKSTLFSSLGPKIPIRMVFSGNFNTDIDIQVEEYGINNVIVKIYLIININERAILPLTSKKSELIIREPIAVDIIKGEIPNYYGFVN